jgi:excisionase family DNA binding protein
LANEELITLAEAAALSGLSQSHLRLLARRGIIEAEKIGRDWLTTKRAVRAYLRDEKLRSKDPLKRKR